MEANPGLAFLIEIDRRNEMRTAIVGRTRESRSAKCDCHASTGTHRGRRRGSVSLRGTTSRVLNLPQCFAELLDHLGILEIEVRGFTVIGCQIV